MSTVAIESPGDAAALGTTRETNRVRAWRFNELLRAGYDADAASRLADRFDVDLHKARALLAKGCPQELALQILL